jgi:hypothetical protein
MRLIATSFLVYSAAISAAPLDVMTYVPDNAKSVLPRLVQLQREQWPAHPYPHFLAGQLEHESCARLNDSKCWSPLAELKTNREYGFGLSQVTIAYNRDGSERFTTFKMLTENVPRLKDWNWEDRYDVDKQLIGFLWMMQTLWDKLSFGRPLERYAFALASYNGGIGSILKDRVLCQSTQGCDPDKWYGNVELHSYKSPIALPGYGNRSPLAINREYPKAIQFTRSPKYQVWFNGASDARSEVKP